MPNRRELLKLLTAVSGATTAAAIMSPVAMASKAVTATAVSNKQLFPTLELETLRQICALTIPATKTPSAADVNCHHFIDHQLRVVFSETEQQASLSVLSKISNAGKQYGNTLFSGLDKTQQIALLTDLEAASAPFSEADRSAFKFIKGQIVFGYYTTMQGATKELKYDPIPGGFKGSVPLSKVGSAFSSKAYY